MGTLQPCLTGKAPRPFGNFAPEASVVARRFGLGAACARTRRLTAFGSPGVRLAISLGAVRSRKQGQRPFGNFAAGGSKPQRAFGWRVVSAPTRRRMAFGSP